MTKVIDDSNWNEELRKPSWRQFKEGVVETSYIFTLQELEEAVEEEQSYMSEEEKYARIRDVSPTYLEWALSSSHQKIKPGQSIEIDLNNHMYRIIENG
jgi:exoribonuclease R